MSNRHGSTKPGKETLRVSALLVCCTSRQHPVKRCKSIFKTPLRQNAFAIAELIRNSRVIEKFLKVRLKN
jgi:hypothetical protein